jgi:ubiquinone/menaquinone biosynthesis C-methylase UbiE
MTNFDTRAKDWDEMPGRVERTNAVAAAIRAQVALSKSMAALEYGCGTGLLSFALQADLGPITLADSSLGMLDVLRKKIAFGRVKNMTPIKLDLAVDTLPLQHFNLVYTLLTLHHIQNTQKILQGFSFLLQPGGVLCIADLDKEDGSFHSDDPDFDGQHGFDRAGLGLDLARAGFKNVRFTDCYNLTKNKRSYPLFLAVAERK